MKIRMGHPNNLIKKLGSDRAEKYAFAARVMHMRNLGGGHAFSPLGGKLHTVLNSLAVNE